jgi:hypothetical protein
MTFAGSFGLSSALRESPGRYDEDVQSRDETSDRFRGERAHEGTYSIRLSSAHRFSEILGG